jgi:hypothetical protein
MPKTLSQAQKQQARDARADERASARTAEREARELMIKNTQQEEKALPASPLSKKELRKQRRDNAQADMVTTPFENERSQLQTPEDLILSVASVRLTESDEALSLEENFAEVSSKRRDPLASESYQQQAILTAAEEHMTAEIEALGSAGAARVVQNHSTYCEGLKPLLLKLQKRLPGCTIIPGEISRVTAHTEIFELRFQRRQDEHTYKFVARSGHTTQDLAISTAGEVYSQEYVCETIKRVVSENQRSSVENSSAFSDNISISSYNRTVQQQRDSFWREEDREKHRRAKERETETRHEKRVEERARHLKTKGIKSALVQEYAERDVDILSGKTRTSHSMRK